MNFYQVIKGVLAAMIGVQSSKNLHKDFTQQSAIPYILVGIIFTILFILTIISIIKFILHT